jgi:hypothetical protein
LRRAGAKQAADNPPSPRKENLDQCEERSETKGPEEHAEKRATACSGAALYPDPSCNQQWREEPASAAKPWRDNVAERVCDEAAPWKDQADRKDDARYSKTKKDERALSGGADEALLPLLTA